MSNGRERRLRSKDETNKPVQQTFNFDNISPLLFRNEEIKVNEGNSYDDLYSSFEDVNFPASHKTSKLINLKVIDRLLPRRNKSKPDPLADSNYEAFHKKMKKEEKNMMNSERLKIMSEVDNLRSQLSLMRQYDWVRHLPKITYIRDIRDYEELLRKRQLTIDEIGRLLKKHDDWRRRQETLLNDIKKYDQGIDSDDDDESILSIPMSTLQEKREKERVLRNGPIIRLALHNGYEILMSPYAIPKIVLAGTDVSCGHNPKKIDPVKKEQHNELTNSHDHSSKRLKRKSSSDHLERKPLTKRKYHRTTLDNTSRNVSEHEEKAFELDSQPLPDMPDLDDEIPNQDDGSSEGDPLIFTEFLKPIPKRRGRPKVSLPCLVRLNPQSLRIFSDKQEDVAFGYAFPKITENDFERSLPLCWRFDLKQVSKIGKNDLRKKLGRIT